MSMKPLLIQNHKPHHAVKRLLLLQLQPESLELPHSNSIRAVSGGDEGKDDTGRER